MRDLSPREGRGGSPLLSEETVHTKLLRLLLANPGRKYLYLSVELCPIFCPSLKRLAGGVAASATYVVKTWSIETWTSRRGKLPTETVLVRAAGGPAR